MDLLVNEIFRSIQGETSTAGRTSLFIRLSGCNLKCSYCDTEYAKNEGTSCSIDKILRIAEKQMPFHHVTITGGEPLIQSNTRILVKKLLENSFDVQIETNGSISIRNISQEARRIVDVKTPSSGESDSFLDEILSDLTQSDELKFVVSNRDDFEFSAEFIKRNRISCLVNFSPVSGAISNEELASLILKSGINARLNLQLHKLIWNNIPENKIMGNLLK